MGFLKVTVELGGNTVKAHTFGDERKVLVGRSAECDVVIDNLGVSRTHCELFWAGHCWVVQDLRSNNGTVVNNRKVATHNVNDGDQITIGKYRINCEVPQDQLEFEIEPPVKIPGYGESTLPIESKKSERAVVPKAKGFLRVDEKARKHFVIEKTVTVIGKGESADIRVEGFFIQRKHALIIRDEAGFLLVDATGKGRSLLNESPIDTERLKDGDTIRVGKRRFTFVVGSPSY